MFLFFADQRAWAWTGRSTHGSWEIWGRCFRGQSRWRCGTDGLTGIISDNWFFPEIPWSEIEDKGLGNCTREIINFLKTWITFEDCFMLWFLWESSIKNLVNFWIESQSYTWFSVVARIQSRLSTYFRMALYIPPVVLHSKGYSFRRGPWKNSRMWHIICTDFSATESRDKQ